MHSQLASNDKPYSDYFDTSKKIESFDHAWIKNNLVTWSYDVLLPSYQALSYCAIRTLYQFQLLLFFSLHDKSGIFIINMATCVGLCHKLMIILLTLTCDRIIECQECQVSSASQRSMLWGIFFGLSFKVIFKMIMSYCFYCSMLASAFLLW